MSNSAESRLQEIFDAAADLPAGERTRFVRSACGEDDALFDEIVGLLRCDSSGKDDVLQSPIRRTHAPAIGPLEVTVLTASPAELPRRIGRYEILRKIGEGGMGVVYEAQQENPRRIVALKVIRSDYTSRETIRRFQREADVLGHLQHAGIAQVYEAGVAEIENASASTGTLATMPFLAMEYVRGEPLTAFATRADISMRQKLEIVAKVCDAVHHAHMNGVIHRDLKPGNILVVAGDSGSGITDRRKPQTDSGSAQGEFVPKILDFGVARLADPDGRAATLQTGVGQIIGTVPYMSPEQVLGDPVQIDTRSDVYSIGVVLYELLSGRLPHDVRNCSIPEAARMIRDEEPARLSTLDARFRGDVATIVAKALEKDKVRRYPSAAELGADLRRYLRDEPIIARPPTTMYHLRKFARRNPWLVVVGAVAVVVGVVSIIVTNMYAWQATRERATALVAKAQSDRTAYQSAISAASAALENHNVELARRHLSQTREELRGWEWRLLESQLDQSVEHWRLPGTFKTQIGFARDGSGLIVARRTSSGDVAQSAVVQRYVGRDRRAENVPLGIFGSINQVLNRDLLATLTFPGGEGEIRDLAADTCEAFGFRDTQYGSPSITSRCISSDGRWVVATIGEAHIALVHSLDLDWTWTWPFVNDGTELAADVSPDGRIAFAADENGAPAIWDPVADRVVRLRNSGSAVSAIAFSADGERVLTGDKDAALRLWDPATGAQLAAAREHKHAVFCTAFSPDGRVAASAGADRSIRVWDAQTLEPIGAFHGHAADVLSLAFSPDGGSLASTALDSTVRIWDLSRAGGPSELRGHRSYVYPVAFSEDGRWIASGGWDGQIRIWDSRTYHCVRTLDVNGTYVDYVAYSPDGRFIAAMCDPANFAVFDAESGAKLAETTADRTMLFMWSDDGESLLVYCDDTQPTGRRWRWRDGVMEEIPLSAFSQYRGFRKSPDGRYVALHLPALPTRGQAPSDWKPQALKIVDIRSGAVVADLPVFFGGRFECAWNPKSKSPRIVVPSQNELKTMDVYELEPLRRIGQLVGHTDEVYGVAWSPDGTRIATGSRDQTVRLWDSETFEEVAQLRGHSSYIWCVAFSPDGTQLVSSSGDGTVRIWDTVPVAERRKINSP